jgi:hypothetical protein
MSRDHVQLDLKVDVLPAMIGIVQIRMAFSVFDRSLHFLIKDDDDTPMIAVGSENGRSWVAADLPSGRVFTAGLPGDVARAVAARYLERGAR